LNARVRRCEQHQPLYFISLLGLVLYKDNSYSPLFSFHRYKMNSESNRGEYCVACTAKNLAQQCPVFHSGECTVDEAHLGRVNVFPKKVQEGKWRCPNSRCKLNFCNSQALTDHWTRCSQVADLVESSLCIVTMVKTLRGDGSRGFNKVKFDVAVRAGKVAFDVGTVKAKISAMNRNEFEEVSGKMVARSNEEVKKMVSYLHGRHSDVVAQLRDGELTKLVRSRLDALMEYGKNSDSSNDDSNSSSSDDSSSSSSSTVTATAVVANVATTATATAANATTASSSDDSNSSSSDDSSSSSSSSVTATAVVANVATTATATAATATTAISATTPTATASTVANVATATSNTLISDSRNCARKRKTAGNGARKGKTAGSDGTRSKKKKRTDVRDSGNNSEDKTGTPHPNVTTRSGRNVKIKRWN
jgi:hypothetical protein